MAGSTTVDTSIDTSGLLEFAKNVNTITGSINNAIKLAGTLGKVWETSQAALSTYNLAITASDLI